MKAAAKTLLLMLNRVASVQVPENRVLTTLFPSEFPEEEEPEPLLIEIPEPLEQECVDNNLINQALESAMESERAPYVHPAECRRYLDSQVVPLIKQGLAALLEEVEHIRLWLTLFLPPCH
jgi:hypothetical protein